MIGKRIISILLVGMWGYVPHVFSGDPCLPNYSGQQDVGVITDGTIDEVSGIVASRINPGVFYAHNDSGDPNRIFAINAQGDFLAELTIDNAPARDWEDIAIGPGPVPGVNYIYIANMGDNAEQYPLKYVYRIPEPTVQVDQAYEERTLYGAETFTFQYPDEIRDAETFMVDPLTKDWFIVSKRENTVRLYRAPWPQSSSSVMTLELIRIMPLGWIVGGDISPSGQRIVIKHGAFAYYWCRDPSESVGDAMGRPAILVPYVQEQQGEAICWALDEGGYYTLSEGHYEHIYFYEDLDAPGDETDPELEIHAPGTDGVVPVFSSSPLVAGTVSDNQEISLVTYALTGATEDIGPVQEFPSTLVPVGAVWKYTEDGADLGTGWRSTFGYDSSWASGPAQLGYGDGDEATVLNYGPDPNNKPITTYYRKVINIPNADVYQTDLELRILHDDGVIVYINGTEVLRENMPDGPVDYLTTAVSTIEGGDENTWVVENVSADLLQSGDNLIAVELHQRSAASSDVSFDLELKAGFGESTWAITNLNLNEGVTTIAVTAADAAGNKDTQVLDLLYAVSDQNSPSISIEAPTDEPDYAMTIDRVVVGGSVSDDQGVHEVEYYFAASPSTRIPAALFSPILVPAGAEWKYVEDGSNQGIGWRVVSGYDSSWGEGEAPLGYGNGDEQTVMGYGGDPNDKPITTYFRHTFHLPQNQVLHQALEFRMRRDDGAIVYLNGIEIFRSNMPDGPIDYLTPAVTTVDGAEEGQWHTAMIPPGLLQAGENLLAVEVHQKTIASSDLRMDAELKYQATAPWVWGAFIDNLSPGDHTIVVVGEDVVGNQGTDSILITYVDTAGGGGGGEDFRIPSIARDPNSGNVMIEWFSESGKTYQVLKCVDQGIGYELFATGIPATPPVNIFIDTSGPTNFCIYAVDEEN